MRVSYTLGVCSSLANRGQIPTRIVASSAGAIPAYAMACGVDLDEFANTLLERLSGDRFINWRRLWRIVDVDYLVDDVVFPLLGANAFQSSHVAVDVSITNAKTALPRYVTVDHNSAREVLRATMSIPLLNGRSVNLDGVEYIDGGVADPVPIVRGAEIASSNADSLLVIVNTEVDELAQHATRRHERIAIAVDPRLSGEVRSVLLHGSPQSALAIEAIQNGRLRGVEVSTVSPTCFDDVASRTETDVSILRRSFESGQLDGISYLSKPPA